MQLPVAFPRRSGKLDALLMFHLWWRESRRISFKIFRWAVLTVLYRMRCRAADLSVCHPSGFLFCQPNELSPVVIVMMKKFPERKYESDQIINGKSFKSDNCYDLFAVGPYQTAKQKRYLSEDYYFSRLWQECGGEIWADMAMPLTHFGNKAFKGHVGSLLEKK